MPNNTKSLTLPSGATCLIHAPSRFTDMKGGSPPQTLVRRSVSEITEGTPAENGKPAVEGRPLNAAEIDYLVAVEKAKLIGCTSPLKLKDGTTVKLVDKPFYEVRHGELCLDDLSTADASMLSNEINGMREEATAKAETFPADPAQPAPAIEDAGSPRPTIQPVTEPDRATAG